MCCNSVPSQDNLSRNWSQVSVNDSYMISVAVHHDDVVALKTNMSEQKPVQVTRRCSWQTCRQICILWAV